jgi:hypothetical protein
MIQLPTNMQNLLIIITIILFIGIFIWTFLTVFSVTAKNDNAANMINAMTNIVIVNLVMVMFFAGIAFWYTNSYPAMQHPYMMFLLHVNILISILAISISSLYTVSQ